MAELKQYGYYLKGNKVAIVERDTTFDNDLNSKDFGPGSDRAQWKSPLSSIVILKRLPEGEFKIIPFVESVISTSFES